MRCLEIKAIDWQRYTDDVFAVFDTSHHVENFVTKLNNINNNIKCMHAIENNQQLPFLHLKIIWKSKINFNIYKKIRGASRIWGRGPATQTSYKEPEKVKKT